MHFIIQFVATHILIKATICKNWCYSAHIISFTLPLSQLDTKTTEIMHQTTDMNINQKG